MTLVDQQDFGIRKIDDKGGYLDGWERLGVGIKPVEIQVEGLVLRGTDGLQFDFCSAYGDAPNDTSLLYDFPDIQAVRCGAAYSDSDPLNSLHSLKSFRDDVYNRTGINWPQFSKLQDLHLHDYHGRHHPNYEIFEDLKFLNVAYLPKKYSFLTDLPIGKVNRLSIHNSSLQSFQGLEKCSVLEEMKIVSCKTFAAENLVDMVSSMKHLTLAFCPNVLSVEFVRYLPSLETLEMESLGKIASFEPLRNHPSLKRIQATPLKGAKISKELRNSMPNLEFISPGLLDYK